MNNLFGFDTLIEKFLKSKITAEEFEEQYIEKHLKENHPLNDEVFQILDWLFAEVDAFSHDPEIFPDEYVSESQLRKSASDTLSKLYALK